MADCCEHCGQAECICIGRVEVIEEMPMSDTAAEHTPGSWWISENGNPRSGWPICADQGPITVCVARANSLPDARLIAVAPDLLAALEEIREAMAMGMVEIAAKYGPDAHPDEPLIDAMYKANAAITKARGET